MTNWIKALTLILLIPMLGLGQSVQERMVDSLRFVIEMPYACEAIGRPDKSDSLIYNIGCGDRFFWQVVKGRQEIIPLLIEKLSDTTLTSASVQYFGGQYAVADVAYTALQEIVMGLPTFDLLGIEFDKQGCGYCSYWTYLRADIENRHRFKTSVRRWYEKNKENMIWIKSDKVLTFDICAFNHPNGGHFEVRR